MSLNSTQKNSYPQNCSSSSASVILPARTVYPLKNAHKFFKKNKIGKFIFTKKYFEECQIGCRNENQFLYFSFFELFFEFFFRNIFFVIFFFQFMFSNLFLIICFSNFIFYFFLEIFFQKKKFFLKKNSKFFLFFYTSNRFSNYKKNYS